jgi:hypothetical protein
MSTFTLELLDVQKNIIEVETSYVNTINNITVEVFDTYNLQIVNTEQILASDLPDNIPMDSIVGNLDVSRIDNLDAYLSEIPVDGGSP